MNKFFFLAKNITIEMVEFYIDSILIELNIDWMNGWLQ